MNDLKKKEAAAIAALKTNEIWGQQLFDGFDLLDV